MHGFANFFIKMDNEKYHCGVRRKVTQFIYLLLITSSIWAIIVEAMIGVVFEK